jgi:hypothetical protein
LPRPDAGVRLTEAIERDLVQVPALRSRAHRGARTRKGENRSPVTGLHQVEHVALPTRVQVAMPDL